MGQCFSKPKECQCYELLIIDNDDILSDLPMMKLYRRKSLYKNLKRKRMTDIYQIYKMENGKLQR
jgi:hypothetical protein